MSDDKEQEFVILSHNKGMKEIVCARVRVVHEKGDYIVHERLNYDSAWCGKWVVAHKPTRLVAWSLKRKSDAIKLCDLLGDLPTVNSRELAAPASIPGVNNIDFGSHVPCKATDIELALFDQSVRENYPPEDVLNKARDIVIEFRNKIYEREKEKSERQW